MTDIKPFFGAFVFILVLMIIACEDRPRTNLFDSQTEIDPSEWSPDSLRIQVIDDSQVLLTWTQEDEHIQGYRVERNENGGRWINAGEVEPASRQFIDDSLKFGADYTFRVCAFTLTGQSDFSISDTVRTIFPAPTDLTVEAYNDNEVQLEWTDNCEFEDGYLIERQNEDDGWSVIGETATDIVHYNDIGTGIITTDIHYQYRVNAFTGINKSNYSDVVYMKIIVADIDGNEYSAVKIGDQWWLTENLKVTHYRNGDAIPLVVWDVDWSNLSSDAYCWYNNYNPNIEIYGLLYNWYSTNDDRGIAPEGWHVPSDDEWKQLEIHLGMSQSQADSLGYRGTDEGRKLKETGTTYWFKHPLYDWDNVFGTNENGFTALGAGYRPENGNWGSLNVAGYFWTSTAIGSDDAWSRKLRDSKSTVGRYNDNFRRGYSIRCVRD